MEIVKLTPAEISSLWNSYLTNTMGLWVLRYFINKTQDKELLSILKYAEEIAKTEVEKSKAFLKGANQPLPQKFDKEDVDVNGPAICTDQFTLIIKYSLAQAAQVVALWISFPWLKKEQQCLPRYDDNNNKIGMSIT